MRRHIKELCSALGRALVLGMIVIVFGGCSVDEVTDNANTMDGGSNATITDDIDAMDEMDPNGYFDAIRTEEEAMGAAEVFFNSDPRFEVTSAIPGPYIEDGIEVDRAWAVTVRDLFDEDTITEVFIDARDGEVIDFVDHNVMEAIEVDIDLPDGASEAWYRYRCPSGWPLCIHRPDRITFYSQRDPSWRGDTLGHGPSTIGSAGCLLTSYAMQLCQNRGSCRNPGQLNSLGRSRGCFSDDIIYNGCLASAAGARYRTISVSQLWSTIASGKAVVVYGRGDCLGGRTHAQMIWGHDGRRYWTKEPWYDYRSQDQPMCISYPSYRVME